MKKKAVKNNIQRYDSYKDSGVEWLGEIPEHWEVLANKFIFHLKKNQVGKKSTDYDLLSLTLRGIVIRNLEDGGKFPAEFDTYQEVKKGDFVFCLFDVEETPRCIGLSDYDGMITGAYTVMEPNENFDRSFLYYFYLNLDADKRMKPLYTGLRNTISKDNFFAFKTFVPPLPEQIKIAQFLDDKTTKIDAAIAIKQQQINLLKERKQILIHKAVTRGLDDSVALKDSGVEWIGEIPVGWEIESFKNILIERNEKNNPIKSKERLSLSIDKGITLYAEKTTNLDRFKDDFSQYKLAYENDLVFNSMNMIVGAVGVSSYFGCISPVYYTYYTNLNNGSITKYYECFFKSRIVQSQLYSMGRGIMAIDRGEGKFNTVRLKVSRNDLRSFKVPFPSLNEIIEIVKYIEILDLKTKTAINLKEQEISKLQEYKSSLINGVVTGKVKVC